MREVRKDFQVGKDIDVNISEITDGIYRISGFSKDFGITFNPFLIEDEKPTLIHTGPIGMYEKVKEKVQEVIPLEKLAYVAFLHFESDEWGGMEFLKSKDVKLLCSDLSSKLNLVGWRAGIFASEDPVRKTTQRLKKLDPKITFPMHGSCIENSLFGKYTDALMTKDFAYSDVLLGQKVQVS